MQLTYEGFIRLKSNGEEDDILWLDTKSDKANIDCVDIWDDEPLAGILESSIRHKKVSVKYYISSEKVTQEVAEDNFIRTIEGDSKVEYQMGYSEYTGYLWTDEEITIGGHDLLKELKSFENQYLLLIIAVFK